MTTRHAVIDSPLGELTLVADGGALTGLYFRSHWYRPSAHTFGPRIDADSDDLLTEARTSWPTTCPVTAPISTWRSDWTATTHSGGSGIC